MDMRLRRVGATSPHGAENRNWGVVAPLTVVLAVTFMSGRWAG
ncbi:hypothetical protein [Streptomyces sp. NPDC087212]